MFCLKIGILVASILWCPGDGQAVSDSEDDIFTVIQDRVSLDNTGRAEGFLDFANHILRCVLHKDS